MLLLGTLPFHRHRLLPRRGRGLHESGRGGRLDATRRSRGRRLWGRGPGSRGGGFGHRGGGRSRALHGHPRRGGSWGLGGRCRGPGRRGCGGGGGGSGGFGLPQLGLGQLLALPVHADGDLHELAAVLVAHVDAVFSRVVGGDLVDQQAGELAALEGDLGVLVTGDLLLVLKPGDLGGRLAEHGAGQAERLRGVNV